MAPEPLTVEAIEKLVALIPRATPVGPFDLDAYFERMKAEGRSPAERIAELLATTTRYLEEARRERRKLAVAMAYLRQIKGHDGNAADDAHEALVEVERTQ
jgi:hypothetical protein